MLPFTDRREAGRVLSQLFGEYSGRKDVVVLALPRGGVPVGYEVAKALRVPLDIFLVRKLGVPWNPEFAFGALGPGGVYVIDRETVATLGITESEVQQVIKQEQQELERRERLYRGYRPLPPLAGKTVILVDDGLATGATMFVAVEVLRRKNPAQIIAAVPVASAEACNMLSTVVDRCVCAAAPKPFHGVGSWYMDFNPTTDAEVVGLLEPV